MTLVFSQQATGNHRIIICRIFCPIYFNNDYLSTFGSRDFKLSFPPPQSIFALNFIQHKLPVLLSAELHNCDTRYRGSCKVDKVCLPLSFSVYRATVTLISRLVIKNVQNATSNDNHNIEKSGIA